MIGVLVLGYVIIHFVEKHNEEVFLEKKTHWYMRAQAVIEDYYRCLDEEEIDFCIKNFFTSSFENYYSLDLFVQEIEERLNKYGSRESFQIIEKTKGYYMKEDDGKTYIRAWFKTKADFTKKKNVTETFYVVKEKDKDYMLLDEIVYEVEE